MTQLWDSFVKMATFNMQPSVINNGFLPGNAHQKCICKLTDAKPWDGPMWKDWHLFSLKFLSELAILLSSRCWSQCTDNTLFENNMLINVQLKTSLLQTPIKVCILCWLPAWNQWGMPRYLLFRIVSAGFLLVIINIISFGLKKIDWRKSQNNNSAFPSPIFSHTALHELQTFLLHYKV